MTGPLGVSLRRDGGWLQSVLVARIEHQRVLAANGRRGPRGVPQIGNIGSMKTTLEIPDVLFRKAKSRGAERGQTLKEFVNDALQEKLAPKRGTARPREPEDRA